jgi:hypothetical protein
MGKELDFNKCGTEGRPNGNCPNRKPEKNISGICKICISDPNIWTLKPIGEKPVLYILFQRGVSIDQAVIAEGMIKEMNNKK